MHTSWVSDKIVNLLQKQGIRIGIPINMHFRNAGIVVVEDSTYKQLGHSSWNLLPESDFKTLLSYLSEQVRFEDKIRDGFAFKVKSAVASLLLSPYRDLLLQYFNYGKTMPTQEILTEKHIDYMNVLYQPEFGRPSMPIFENGKGCHYNIEKDTISMSTLTPTRRLVAGKHFFHKTTTWPEKEILFHELLHSTLRKMPKFRLGFNKLKDFRKITGADTLSLWSHSEEFLVINRCNQGRTQNRVFHLQSLSTLKEATQMFSSDFSEEKKTKESLSSLILLKLRYFDPYFKICRFLATNKRNPAARRVKLLQKIDAQEQTIISTLEDMQEVAFSKEAEEAKNKETPEPAASTKVKATLE